MPRLRPCPFAGTDPAPPTAGSTAQRLTRVFSQLLQSPCQPAGTDPAAADYLLSMSTVPAEIDYPIAPKYYCKAFEIRATCILFLKN